MKSPMTIRTPTACLQSRDPFSGDCDPVNPSCFSRVPTASCRAETRSQGIATERPLQRGNHRRDIVLQSRDPFSGDCDWSLHAQSGGT